MFCGNCGQEIPAGNRFCGMCGTPMPQRPITPPGAQSTLRFTRLPTESMAATRDPSTLGSRVISKAVRDDRSAIASPTLEVSTSNILLPDLVGDAYAPEPEQNLAPEPSLERFIEQFKYEPPTESELTMGGTPIPPTEQFRPIVVPPQPSDAVVADPPAIDRKVFVAQEPAAIVPEAARSGIGLVEPVGEPAERSRFLDLRESASEHPRSGTSTIVGPSFLGLSDAPDLPAGYELETPEPSGGSWRIWLALIVLAMVGVLGFLEWRSQTHQTTSPIQVIKMQIQRLRHGSAPDNSTANQSTDTNAAKPEMQVEPQTKVSDTTTGVANGTNSGASSAPPAVTSSASASPQATNASNPNAAQGTNAPTGNQSVTGANSAPPPKTPPAKDAADRGADTPNGAAAKSSEANDASAKLKRPAAEDEEVTTRKVVPGQEEMTKAEQASDSAAAAAWLWKSTAKGNSDAPVRLADMYVKGEGVPKSCDQALVLLKSAAGKQNARARNRLGSLYATGTCVGRDRVQAYKWMSLALVADPGSEWAQQNRDLLWRQMTPDERSAAAKYQ